MESSAVVPHLGHNVNSIITHIPSHKIRAAVDCISCDGHTIFDPEKFMAATGWSPNEIQPWVREYRSDFSSPKSTIYDHEGNAMTLLRGIYGLVLLRDIASALKIKYTPALGRGFEARAITRAIVVHLDIMDASTRWCARSQRGNSTLHT